MVAPHIFAVYGCLTKPPKDLQFFRYFTVDPSELAFEIKRAFKWNLTRLIVSSLHVVQEAEAAE